jgi:hypothetical protein
MTEKFSVATDPTYLDKLENTILLYRSRAAHSHIPWLWNFLADSLSGTALVERRHQKQRGMRKAVGWKEYTLIPLRKIWELVRR